MHHLTAVALGLTVSLCAVAEGSPPIHSSLNSAVTPAFDLLQTHVYVDGPDLVFRQQVAGLAGSVKPTPTGKLGGSEVFSYVWPTSLDSVTVGFEPKQGILALALTAHPDFDDTPRYDENRDGNAENDGHVWHSHWVVLVKDDACGAGALKVKDIPEGEKPRLPATWPGLPLLLDSPGYEPGMQDTGVAIRVPLKDIGFNADFSFDGVTAGLKVNASVHNPLLCVVDVRDVASGDLSLPGKVRQ
jgi:hypothetical protein